MKKVLTPAGELGTEIGGISLGAIGRTAGLLPGLLLASVNGNADPAKYREQLNIPVARLRKEL